MITQEISDKISHPFIKDKLNSKTKKKERKTDMFYYEIHQCLCGWTRLFNLPFGIILALVKYETSYTL